MAIENIGMPITPRRCKYRSSCMHICSEPLPFGPHARGIMAVVAVHRPDGIAPRAESTVTAGQVRSGQTAVLSRPAGISLPEQTAPRPP